MKIALCLYGQPPMAHCAAHEVKTNLGLEITEDLSHKYWEENFIKINSPDIFIHCWDKADNENLKRKYSPKLRSCIFEDPKIFDTTTVCYRGLKPVKSIAGEFFSQAYSAKESIKLKQKYESQNNFTYDLVMLARLDLLWFEPIDIKRTNPKPHKQLDPKCFYIPNWNQNNTDSGKRETYLNNITTTNRRYKKILDYFFISNSEYINKFSNLFDYIPEYINNTARAVEREKQKRSNHILKREYLQEIGLWDKRIIKFIYYEGYDFNLQRKFYQWNFNKKKSRFGYKPLSDKYMRDSIYWTCNGNPIPVNKLQ